MSKERNPVRYWSEYLPTLKQKGINEALSSVFFRSAPLNRWIRKKLSEGWQSGESLVADPVFEAVFGWRESNSTYGGLVKRGLLLEETLNAVNRPESPRIDPKWKVYQHQLQAFEALGDRQRRNSIIVSSGTGSGKTECFMLPLLDDLAREVPPGALPGRGVRALFLYPLNALIESQQERLSNWTRPFNGRIKFCRYNGNTPETLPSTVKPAPEEVQDRKTLREVVPQMLLSNPSMIERMLMRDEDQVVLSATRKAKCFRWVIIDEAHTYIGSKAADMALLLRRVMNAFGADPSEVHFVATSATVDASDEKAKEALKNFLLDLSGSRPEQIHLILGERKRPADITVTDDNGLGIADLLAIADRDYNSGKADYPELKAALLGNKKAMYIRSYFIANQHARLSKLQETTNTANPVEMLQWLDVLTAVPDLLPLRVHQFLNSTGLLYACPDPNCPHKDAELVDADWHFGSLYFEGRKTCRCGAPLFPVAACSHCNSVTLKAVVDSATMQIAPPDSVNEDERFWRFIEESGQNDAAEIVNPTVTNATDNVEDADESDNDQPAADSLESDDSKENSDTADSWSSLTTMDAHICNTDNVSMQLPIAWEQNGEKHECTAGVMLQEENTKGETVLRCAACDSELPPSKFYLRRISSRYFQMLLPYLIEHCLTDSKSDYPRPMDGRRLISFTDSRQGTAKTAALIEREGERSFVMSFLYQQLLKGCQPDSKNQNLLNLLVTSYKQNPDPVVLEEIEKFRPKTEISWNDAIEAIREFLGKNQSSATRQLVHSMWQANELEAGRAQDTAKILLLREFNRRPVNGRNLETCGLVSLHYTALDGIVEADVPTIWKAKNLTLSDWKNYLKHCIDFFVRPEHCLPFPSEWRNHGGNRLTYTKILVKSDADKVNRLQRRWPQISPNRKGQTSRFLRYTAGLLGYGTEAEAYDNDAIEDTNRLLQSAFEALKTRKQLEPENGGHVLNMEKVAIKLNKEVWVFDNNRLYDVIVGPENRTLCPEDLASTKARKITLPTTDATYEAWCTEREATLASVRRQLQQNPAYENAVMNGRWSALATHALENTGYFSAAEHTAQLDKGTRSHFTEDFKKGYINVLNCSTTMEMGVDLSDINTVVMNNVPPHPANYLQRAGRAGRRNETRANTFTLCGSTPRDRHIFQNPDWALTERQPQMQVALTSAQLVQRHVNAQLLSDFFSSGHTEDQLRLQVEHWLTGLGERFEAWLKDLSLHAIPAPLVSNIQTITRRSALSHVPAKQLIDNARTQISGISRFWQERLKLYNLRLKTFENKDDRAANAVKYQKLEFTSRPLYDALTRDLFLPSSIYITNVTQFNNLSEQMEDHRFKKDYKNQFKRRKRTPNDLPSREAAVGIYEYAPGSSVVIDNKVYESAGIERTWVMPAEGGKVQVDEMRRYCRCQSCGENFLINSEAEAICPGCGKPVPGENIQTAIIPKKFCVERYNEPHNDISRLVTFKRQDDFVHLDASWSNLGRNQNAIAVRTGTEGSVISHNPGKGNGFNLCLACGWARPAESDEDDVRHFPVRSVGPEFTTQDGHCVGGEEGSYLLKPQVILASEFKTDCLQVSFPLSKKLTLSSDRTSRIRSAGLGLCIVLRRAIAQHYGIEEDELGFAYQHLPQRSRLVVSIYDKKMSGYSSNLGNAIVGILQEARSYLNCPNQCAASCPACLQTFDSRSKERNLSRFDALEVFSEALLALLTADEDHRTFAGDDSEYLTYGLRSSIEEALLSEKADQVILRLERPADDLNLRTSDAISFAAQLCNKNLGSALSLEAAGFSWAELSENFIPTLQYLASCGVRFLQETSAADDLTSRLSAVLKMTDGSFRGIALDSDAAEDLRSHWQFESPDPKSAPTQAYIGRIRALPEAKECPAPAVKEIVTQESPNAAAVVPTLNFNHFNRMTFQNFGECLLQAAAQAHGEDSFGDLLARKVKDAALMSVTYSDRYLVRVMDPALVLSVFQAVIQATDCTEDTEFIMKTHPYDKSGRNPVKLRNYWRDDISREDTLNTLTSLVKQGKYGWSPTSVRFDIEEDLPHARQLTLIFRSGEKYVLQLDRGMSFINAECSIPNTVRFDHQEAFEVNLARYLCRLTTASGIREDDVFCLEQSPIFSWFEN